LIARFQDADGFAGYRSALLGQLGVPHLFTTRCSASRSELDMGALEPRDHERLQRALQRPGSAIASLWQVHGAGVRVVDAHFPLASRPEGDGLVTEREDVLLCVHVADCVPVLLAAEDGRRVAAVHAGWRGLVAGVIPRALEALGARAPLAAVGPCLSRARFEVGPEVAEAFERAGLGLAIHERPGQRPHIDLCAAAEHQLRAGGVRAIDSNDRCTWEAAEDFYSYRRDVTHGDRERTGRLGALIAVRTGGRPLSRPG